MQRRSVSASGQQASCKVQGVRWVTTLLLELLLLLLGLLVLLVLLVVLLQPRM